MTEEIENLGKAIRLKADCLEKETLEKFNSLFSEKQRVRKLYQEEHSRISAQFSQVCACSCLTGQPARCGPAGAALARPAAARVPQPRAARRPPAGP